MYVNHRVIVSSGGDKIACFEKTIEMECLPPVGSSVEFGSVFSVSVKADSLLFSEDESRYTVLYNIDVLERSDSLNEYVGDDFYPIKLVNYCGFDVLWIEDDYKDIESSFVKGKNLELGYSYGK